MLTLIAAMTKNRVIGAKGTLPWKQVKTDMDHFRSVTRAKPVIMGRKTYDSLPEGRRPLPGRLNIILTRDTSYNAPGAVVVDSLDKAIDLAEKNNPDVYVIGGEGVFREALPVADAIYLTEVDTEIEGDAYFPEFDLNEWELASEQPFEKNADNQYAGVIRLYKRHDRR